MGAKSLICGAALAVPMIIYQRGDENRLLHSLEARGYTDIQIEHPNQYHCSRGDSSFSYRARSPSGTPVHGVGPRLLVLLHHDHRADREETVRPRLNRAARVDRDAADRNDPQPIFLVLFISRPESICLNARALDVAE